MLQIDPLSLIPDSLKTAVRDAVVDFVFNQAKKMLGDEVSSKIKKLRSDAAFNTKFEQGLKKALKRFVDEYAEQDEDLVAAIQVDATVFQNAQVQKALLEMLKNPGRYLVDEHEAVAENFDTVLPGRKNRERVDKAITFLLHCLAEELWNLPELQPIYSLQFQRMTAESTHRQVALQKAQLQEIKTMNEGVRHALLQLTDAIAEKKLLGDGGEFHLKNAVMAHNLPQPNYTNFVGREQELQSILDKLRPYPRSQEHLITIDGIGGIGKSALALEVAYRCLRNSDSLPDDERFDAIIWTSAKKTILTSDGIKTRHQILQTLDEIYTTIAITLGKEGLTRTRPDEQAELIRSILSTKRCLIIIDNLETIDDETVISFLMELPAPTKAIVTTRHRIDVAYPVRLLGMPKDDALDLINNECALKNIDLPTEQREILFDRTGGVPLAILWSLSQITAGYTIKQVLHRLGSPISDIAKFCFEGVIRKIANKPALSLLIAIAIFESDTSREMLGALTNLNELDRDDGLVLLEKLSLINKKSGRFNALPLTKQYAMSMTNTEDATTLRRKQMDYYVEKIKIFSSMRQVGDIETQNERDRFLTFEIKNILNLIDWCVARGENENLVTLIRGITSHLWGRGYWNSYEKFVKLGLQISHEQSKDDLEAYFAFRLGRLYLMRGEYPSAEKYLGQGVELYEIQKDISRLAHNASYLGLLFANKNRYDDAKKLLMNILEMAREVEDKKAIARIQNILGRVNLDLGEYAFAEQAFLEAKELRESEGFSTGLAASYELLGRLKLDQNLPEEALPLLEKCLAISEANNVLYFSAFAKKWIAQALIMLGKSQEAITPLQECIEMFKNLNMKNHIEESEKMLQEIEQ